MITCEVLFTSRRAALPFMCLLALLLCLSMPKLYAQGSGQAVLLLTKTVSATSSAPGGIVTYTIAYSNIGAVTNVVITDVLPANLYYIASSASGNASYTVNPNTLSWSLGALASDSGGQVTFQATVADTALMGTRISNTASISSTEVTTPITSSISFTVAANHGDWWMFHHDLQHTGRSAYTGPNTPGQLWAFAVGAAGDEVTSSPTLGADGTIYVGSWAGNLCALNPDGTQTVSYTHLTLPTIYSV